MNDMKKIILAALASAVFAICAMAQSRPSIIVSAGYQGANISNVDNAKMVSGVRAGVALDFSVLDMGTMALSVQPGVNFSMKGASLGANLKTSLYYVDLPILANLSFDVGSNLSAFINAGPYFAYGVGGSSKIGDAKNSTNPFKVTKIGKSELKAYNAFDWGLQVGAGVEFSRVMLGVGTQFGLYDITHNLEVPILGGIGKKNNNNSFFVTLGYRF